MNFFHYENSPGVVSTILEQVNPLLCSMDNTAQLSPTAGVRGGYQSLVIISYNRATTSSEQFRLEPSTICYSFKDHYATD